MNKRILSGIVSAAMLIGSAAYLPADTFTIGAEAKLVTGPVEDAVTHDQDNGGNVPDTSAGNIQNDHPGGAAFGGGSTSEPSGGGTGQGTIGGGDESFVLPEDAVVFKKGSEVLWLEPNADPLDYEKNANRLNLSFDSVVTLSDLTGLGKLYVQVRFKKLSDAQLSYTDFGVTPYFQLTPKDGWQWFNDTEPHYANSKGNAVFFVTPSEDSFSGWPEGDPELLSAGLQFYLKEDAYSKVSSDIDLNCVTVSYVIYAVDTNKKDEYKPGHYHYFDEVKGEIIKDEIVSIDLKELEPDVDGQYRLDSEIFGGDKTLDDLIVLGKICVQIGILRYDDLTSNDISFAIIVDGFHVSDMYSITNTDSEYIDLTKNSPFLLSSHFDGLYLTAEFGKNINAEYVSDNSPKVYFNYRVIRLYTADEMFDYKEISNNTEVCITNYKMDFDEVEIPETIDGKTVTKIGNEAFKSKGLTSVEIPKTVKEIGDSAFMDNPDLHYVAIYNKNCWFSHHSIGYDKSQEKIPDFTIACYPGSSAESYAVINGFNIDYFVPDDLFAPTKNKILRQSSGTIDSSFTDETGRIIWMDTVDTDPSWEELSQRKTYQLEAIVIKKFADFDYQDLRAAIFVEDVHGEIRFIKETPFVEKGRVVITTPITEELFDPEGDKNIKRTGVCIYLKEDNNLIPDDNGRIVSVAYRLSYNQNDYVPDPDFEFPEAEGTVRDDESMQFGISKDNNGQISYDGSERNFFGDKPWSHVFGEEHWTVQAHLTYLENGIKPTDLKLNLIGTDETTGETVTVSAKFDENGYAAAESDIDQAVFSFKALNKAKFFGFTVTADDKALSALENGADLNAELDFRITKDAGKHVSNDSSLYYTVNGGNLNTDRFSIYSGSWKEFKNRGQMEVTGTLSRLPNGLSYSDFYIMIQSETTQETDEVYRYNLDDDGEFDIIIDIDEDSFNSSGSAEISTVDLILGFNGQETADQLGIYDYAQFDYNVDYYPVQTTGFEVNDLVFEILDEEEKSLILTDYKGSSSTLVVPERIADYTVRKIGPEAFAGNENLASIDIPDTVEEIGDRAFAGAVNLNTFIRVPASLLKIGDEAFKGTALDSIILPEGLVEIGCDAFRDCPDLEYAVIPYAVETMQKNTVYDPDTMSFVDLLPFDKSTVIRCVEDSAAYRAATEAGYTVKVIDGQYDLPEYEWSGDFSTVTATRYCWYEPDNSESETVNTRSETHEGDCIHDSCIEYIAEFDNGAFTTQTYRVVTGQATGVHTPGKQTKENYNYKTHEYDLVSVCTVCGETYTEHLTADLTALRLGDMNQDGNITRLDVVHASRCVSNPDYAQMFDIKLGDMDHNDSLTRLDVVMLSRMVSGSPGFDIVFYPYAETKE